MMMIKKGLMMIPKNNAATTNGHQDSNDHVDVDVEIVAPLTRSKMIQQQSRSSSFGESLGQILFYDDPTGDDDDNDYDDDDQNNNDRRRGKRRLSPCRRDVRELVVAVLIFGLGWYGPQCILLPYYFAALLDDHQNIPPFQTTKAGDVLVDFMLNQPLVEPPTIPGPVLVAGSVYVPLILVTVGELLRKHRMVRGGHRQRRRRPFYAIAAFLVSIGVTEGLTQLLKLTIRRKRPNYYALCGFLVTTRQCTADIQRVREAQYSFPSGHSSLSAAAAIFCLWFFVAKILAASSSSSQSPRGGMLSMPTQRFAVATIVTIGLGWTVLVGTSRLVDRWHHPSDVLAGWLLGGLVATIIYHLYYHPIWHPTHAAVPLC